MYSVCFSGGSFDSEETFQLHRRFKELVDANDRLRKAAGVKSSSTSSSAQSSRCSADLPNCPVSNGTSTTTRQHESLLSPRSPSYNTNTSSVVVSPLTGTRLVSRGGPIEDVSCTISPLTGRRLPSRGVTEDASSPRVSSYTSPMYSNGLATERGTPSSSSYASRLAPTTTQPSFLDRLDNASDGLAARAVVNGGGMSRYGDKGPDKSTTSYVARSRLDDASSPAACLQSLRDTYSSTMWNDSVSSPTRRDQRGWASVDGPTSRLSDVDPTTELLSGVPTASSRYEQVMSARPRSLRRGDVATAARNRMTSPVATARLEMNHNLSDVLLMSTVDQQAPVRSTPYSVSSHSERMKSYAVGASGQHAKAPDATPPITLVSTSTTVDKIGQQLSEMTILPSNHHDTTLTTHAVSHTSSVNSPPLVNGTEMSVKTDTSPILEKRATDVYSLASSSKTTTANGYTYPPEVGRCHLLSSSSSLSDGYRDTKNDEHAASTNSLETRTSQEKCLTSGTAASLEINQSLKTDVDDIAGESFVAATLNKLQAAAAAAGEAADSLGRVVATSPVTLSPVSSSEQSTTTNDNRHDKDRPVIAAESSASSSHTGRARSRAPASLQEMLGGKNVTSSPLSVKQTDDTASTKPGGSVKSRSKTHANVQEMLTPVAGSTGLGGRADRESANISSTSANVTTTRSRTSSISSAPEKKSGSIAPTKLSSQSFRRQTTSSAAASRGRPTTTDRRQNAPPQQTPNSTSATKATVPVKDRKTASKTTTATSNRTSEAAIKTSTMVGEDDWQTTLTDIIQASSAASEQSLPSSPSMSSLQSELPPSLTPQTRKKSTSGEALSLLMRPTASSMARRGSTGGPGQSPAAAAGRPSYAAPTSSSASKSTPSHAMLRTSSTPTLRLGSSLSIPSRPAAAGTTSGRTTPTSPHRTVDTTAAGRASKTAINPASTPARPSRPGTTTNTGQRVAGRTTINSRSRNNSTSSSSGDRAGTSRR